MGLFGNNYSTGNDDLAIAPGAKDGKLYKYIQLIAISVLIIAIVLVVLGAFQVLSMGTTAYGIIISIGVVGIGGFVALPWVRVFENLKDKRYRITAITFLAVVGVCVVLWIVCVWLIIGLVEKGISGASEEILDDLLDSLNLIRISIIISMQFVVASYVAKNIIKYNKTLLPYQIIAGVAQLYIDFYFCLILTAITITTEGVELSSTAIFLTNKLVHALFAIFVIVSIFPGIVFRRVDKRRLLEARASAQNKAPGEYYSVTTDVAADGENGTDSAKTEDSDSADEKLKKIKSLLDQGLITQEEYDKKREDILNSI